MRIGEERTLPVFAHESPSLIARNSSRACYRVVNPRPRCFNLFLLSEITRWMERTNRNELPKQTAFRTRELHATSVPDLSPWLRPPRNSLRNYLDGKSGRIRASFADNHRKSFPSWIYEAGSNEEGCWRAVTNVWYLNFAEVSRKERTFACDELFRWCRIIEQ